MTGVGEMLGPRLVFYSSDIRFLIGLLDIADPAVQYGPYCSNKSINFDNTVCVRLNKE